MKSTNFFPFIIVLLVFTFFCVSRSMLFSQSPQWLDKSFNPALEAQPEGYSPVGLSKDAIYVKAVVPFSHNGGVRIDEKIYKIYNSGNIDTSWNPPVSVSMFSGAIADFSVDATGAATIGGYVYDLTEPRDGSQDYYMVKLLPDGRRNEAFSPVPISVDQGGFLTGMTRLRDGRVLFGFRRWVGLFDLKSHFFANNANGGSDPSFVLNADGDAGFTALNNGDFLATGYPLRLGGTKEKLLQRYKPDLAIDPLFNPPDFTPTSSAQSIQWIEDTSDPGALFLALLSSTNDGVFRGFRLNNQPAALIYRLLSNGALDPKFQPFHSSFAPVGQAEALHIRDVNSKKVLISFQKYNPINELSELYLRKIDRSTGLLDSTFNPKLAFASGSDSFNSRGYKLLNNEQVELEGGFTFINNSEVSQTQKNFKLNPNGSLDGSFVPPPMSLSVRDERGFDTYYETLNLPDRRKILYGGYITTVNGQPRSGLCLLRADGSLDPDFRPQINYPNNVTKFLNVSSLESGDVVLFGNFIVVNDLPRPAGMAKILLNTAQAEEYPVIKSLDVTRGLLTFMEIPKARSYRVEWSATMAPGSWSQESPGVAQIQPIGAGERTVSVGIIRPPCFYRVVAVLESLEPPTPVGFSFVPAGTFQMGDALDGMTDAPVRNVDVRAFYIAKTEVTKAEWDEVRLWGEARGYTDLALGGGKSGNYPIEVTWWDAVKWCNAKSEKDALTPVYTVNGSVLRTGMTDPTANWNTNGYRLPTEAEWEKAARGGLNSRRFPWGNTISHSQANYFSYSGPDYDVGPSREYHPTYAVRLLPWTSPVGSFAANGYGLYDMTGNVMEWCWDWYGSYASGAATDPMGSSSGSLRVYRGGSWNGNAFISRVAFRNAIIPSYWSLPSFYDGSIGFRWARGQ
jgi:sulfatase modifying factor 1